MTQYRLLEKDVDTLIYTDEFWDEMKRQWSVIPDNLIGRPFIGFIPYRRAILDPKPTTRKVILKEWVCWENANPECKWLAWCAVSPAEPMDTQANWDNAVPTGQEREIEV